MKSLTPLFILVGLVAVIVGCQHHPRHSGGQHNEQASLGPSSAVATISPLGKSKVSGAAKFMRTENQIMQVDVVLKGLKSNGTHGFHIHQYGDCSASDGASAGGHYNPGNQVHGGPEGSARHMGDLGNLTADKNGEVRMTLVLSGQIQDLAGRSVVVHAQEDDLRSQPAGNSGARIACGVIGIAQ